DARRAQRFAGRAVGDELDRPEDAFAAHFADRLVLLGELAQAGRDLLLADTARVLDDALGLHRVQRADDRRGRERVPAVGEATREHALVERRGDRPGDDDAADRHVAGVDAFREG